MTTSSSMDILVVACSRDWRTHPTAIGTAISRARAQLAAGPMRRLIGGLQRYSAKDNLAAWMRSKAYLDRCADYIFHNHPAVWFRSFGIKKPDYATLLFHDTINGGKLADQFGLQRCLALIGLYAYAMRDMKGAGRSLLLFSHHSDLRRSWNSHRPRATRKGKPSKQEIREILRQLKTIPKRKRASEAERLLSLRGKFISSRRLRDYLKGENGN